ncbi:MAG: polyprenol monophosphomannose synthase [Candidatus Lokiarchaeota archaeon]|nr:polyprenol monophosphomannose synthase [Candidatus Lokiarchaeota archaeon]
MARKHLAANDADGKPRIIAKQETRGQEPGRSDIPAKKIGIVLPSLREAPNLERLIPSIEAIFARHGIDGHIFVIDDDSRDGTDGIVRGFAREFRNITYVQRTGKHGLGSAYRLGFTHALRAGMDIVFEMDADFSHRPLYIPLFLECMDRTRADLVIGSRYCVRGGTDGWPLKRRLISLVANILTQFALGINQTRDMTSGFRAYTARALRSIDYEALETNGYAWQIETLYKSRMQGHAINEIPIIFHERNTGESKLGTRDIFEFITFLFHAILFRVKQLRISRERKQW